MVNTAVLGMVAPIVTLFIVPVVAGLIITLPVPVGEILTDALVPVTLKAPLADKLVNAPVLGAVVPIAMLFIDPNVFGLIVTVPVPVGAIVILEFAELNVTDPVTVNALNVPALGVVAPIVTLSSDPSVLGLTTKDVVTAKLGNVPLVANDSVLVAALVVTTIPLFPTTVSVLFVEFNPTVVCPATAR